MERIERFADKLIWVFISLYIAIFSYLSFLKYYSFSYYDWDFASDIIVYWNSVNGKFLYYPFLETNIFGCHLYLIILLLIPIYTIFQHPLTLLFLQSIFLGLAAYPLYLLAKLKLNKSLALGLSLGYLLYPSLGFVNLFETHFDIYAIFLLFFAIYYFEKESFNRFLLFLFLAITCKENVSMVVFMLGIYAVLRKRAKKWVIIPCLLGMGWFFLSIKFVIPHFAKEKGLYPGGFMFATYYQHLGDNIFEMIKTIIFHPMDVAKYVLLKRNLLYIFQLFLPTGFLGFLSPGVLLLTIPIFMQNLLSAIPIHASIYFQYTCLLIPFIFWGAINGLKRLSGYSNWLYLLFGVLFFAIISNIYLKAPQLDILKYVKDYRIDEYAEEKENLIGIIPRDASCIASFQFLPHLAQRKHLYSIHFVSTGFKMYTNVPYKIPRNLEYSLIDFNEPLLVRAFFPPSAPWNIRSFLKEGGWRVLRAFDDIVLFKKNLPKGNKLCEIIDNPKIQNIIDANIGNQIILLGYDMGGYKDKILHLTYYWKRVGEIDKPLGFFVQFLNSRGKILLQKIHIPGYRIYPPEIWPWNKIIKEHHYIFIPSSIKKTNYNIRLGLFFWKDGRVLPILENNRIISDKGIILPNISIR